MWDTIMGFYLRNESFLELKALLKEVINSQGQIQRRMERMMSKIAEFATAMTAYFDRQDVAIDGLKGDIDWMVAKIAELQGTAGAITPEDQKLLDDLQVRAGGAATKAEALDAMTPPPVPVTP